MSPVHYVLVAAVAIYFVIKLAYHLFYEIPRDREILARRRDGQ